MSKNPGNVAGGLKATMNNPNVSDEAKDNAKERLDQLEHGANVDDVASSGSSSKASGEKNPGNVIGGLKGALNSELPLSCGFFAVQAHLMHIFCRPQQL